ncbi:c-type cytochrome domain-containing protein [Compostibacter hankyongensis]|uniref:c-type cytochrome domain-containing protein n=1 Tax=Compostibacter hankyongensis TaxID=1007089 RepID=UPI0031ED6F2B
MQVSQIGWNEMIGRWHPLLVHLPIGILLIAIILEFLGRYSRFPGLKAGVPVVLFIGMLSAVASCVAGYCLSLSGGYDEALLSRHKWLGIGAAVISAAVYLLYRKKNHLRFKRLNVLDTSLWVLMLFLLTAAGHYGGSLTHGSEYLAETFPSFLQKWIYGRDLSSRSARIDNIQEAFAYRDVVQPILTTKCYSCHSAGKEKGALRLDSIKFIREGGENGKVLLPGHPEQSELFKRIMLAEDDDEHMPPKGRPQLSIHQALLLRWWIEQGCPFDKKVGELSQPADIKPLLEALQSKGNGESNIFVPETTVPEADTKAIAALEKTGIQVLALSDNSPYLKVDAINARTFDDGHTALLLPLKKQLAWLKLGNTQITDKGLKNLSGLSSLTRLELENTAVSDSGLTYLLPLKLLKYLNLTGTRVSDKGLEQLVRMKQLTELYLYRTRVSAEGVRLLQQKLPKLYIDTGNYQLPALPTDTIVF